MMSLFVKLRRLLGVLLLLLIFVVYWLYGSQNAGLWFLAIPLLTMQRRRWNDTQHTILTWVWGSLGLLSLLIYLLVVLAEVAILSFFNSDLLQANEFSLLAILVFWVSAFTHLSFAIIERHDEPKDIGA